MKKYADYTAEEKAQYKAKRDAYWQKRSEDASNGFALLEAELKALNAPQSCFDALAIAKKGMKGGGERQQKDGYLTALFGSETPQVGTVSTFLYVGIRGPNGERMLANETLPQFIQRTNCADLNYKYSANDIGSMAWYLKRRGYIVAIDREKATVTYVSKETTTAAKVVEVAKPKAELIKHPKNT